MAVFNGVLKADEDAGCHTNDEDETEDDKGGDKYKDKQAIIIFRVPGWNRLIKLFKCYKIWLH